MAVTLDFEVEVSLRSLRQALSSVVPHAEPTKTNDEPSPLCRVRLVFGRDELLVMASNSLTTAMAAVELDDGTDTRREWFAPDDAPYVMDVEPGIVRKLLQQFKAARPTADADDSPAGLILHADGKFSIEDRDGLIPGMLSRYPHLALSDSFPPVLDVLAQAARMASGEAAAKPLIAEQKALRLFAHAAEAYARPLTFEPVGRAGQYGWWVWCSGGFQGVISSADPGGDSLNRRQMERMAHLQRLGIAPADPVAEAEAALGAETAGV